METQYHRANINHSHDLVKARYSPCCATRILGLHYTNYGKGASSSLMLHCDLIAVYGPAGTCDKKGHSHENLLVRQARGRAGTTRTKWEYHISRRGIRWLSWNVDKAGLLDIILEELGLIPQTNPTDNKLIPDPESNTTSELPDDEIKRICQEVLNKHRTQNNNKDGLDGNSK
jgi:hypothetical protein